MGCWWRKWSWKGGESRKGRDNGRACVIDLQRWYHRQFHFVITKCPQGCIYGSAELSV
jgi:hypothetical protein